jgi:hypothetical protein
MWWFYLTQEQGNNQLLVNVTDITNAYGQHHCCAFLFLHAYISCDTTSAYKGIRKVTPIQVPLENPRFVETIAHLGDKWAVSEEIKVMQY